jgi:hypothetical protein
MATQARPSSSDSHRSSSAASSTSISSTSADSTQSSSSKKPWVQRLFGDKPTDTQADRERVEMWRIMSMGYENVGQYVDVGEWVGR